MQQIFSNTTLTVNQLIEKIDTGELGLPELQRPFIIWELDKEGKFISITLYDQSAEVIEYAIKELSFDNQ